MVKWSYRAGAADMGGARRAARLLTTLTVGVLVSYALGGGVAARGIDQATPVPQACDPCPLSRVVVDTPAWDETVTVIDRAAWDETVTVVDTPASTAYRTVVDAPAHSVAHHDLVTPAYTVARQVLVTPAHDESYQLWVNSGYWTQHWIDTSHYETLTVWVTSGYSQPYWQDTSHGEVQSVYVSQGYWYTYWVETGGYWSCSGHGEDRECDYYSSGYWTNMWIDNSYSYNQYVWIASGYWASYWVDTSHYEYPQVWVSSGYYEQRWVETGGYWATAYTPRTCSGSGVDRECEGGDPYSYWQSIGYYSTDFWVDTSHYETRTRHVDDVFTTVYDTVAAVYSDWIEPVAAVTHQEAYTVPAVTHTTTVHHDAVTHTEVVHHPAVTHLEPITVDQLTTQNRQSAAASSSGAVGGSDGRASAPTTIAVVSNITVVDRPAGTATRTVVDRAAYDESRTVVDRPAYDDSYTRPVYDYACDDGPCVRYIDYWETVTVHHDAVTYVANVHHDAVTHDETVDVPAVTHQETLRYDAIVGDGAPSGSGGDPLADFALIAGLMALAGAGKYASRADELKAAVAEMTGLGLPIPAAVEPILIDSSPETVSQVDAAISDAVSSGDVTIDPGFVDNTQQSERQSDAPPNGTETAAARAQFDASLKESSGAASGRSWWDQLVDGAKAKLREGAYAVAETGNTAAALVRAGAYDVAETGNTAAAIARAVSYDVAETGNTAAAIVRSGMYAAADNAVPLLNDTPVWGGLSQTVEAIWLLNKTDRTAEENRRLFGPNVEIVKYLDPATLQIIDVATKADGGLIGTQNRDRFGALNSITLGESLVVTPLDKDKFDPATNNIGRHEGGHTRQAHEKKEGYLPTYGLEYVETVLGNLAGALTGSVDDPLDSETIHKNHPMEIDANDRAKLPQDWNLQTPVARENPLHWIKLSDLSSGDGSDMLDATASPGTRNGAPAGTGGSGGGGRLMSLRDDTAAQSESAGPTPPIDDTRDATTSVPDVNPEPPAQRDAVSAVDYESNAAPQVESEAQAAPETETPVDNAEGGFEWADVSFVE